MLIEILSYIDIWKIMEILFYLNIIFSAKNIIDVWRLLLNFRESVENESKDADEISIFSKHVELEIKNIQNPSAVQYMLKFLKKFKDSDQTL